MLYFEMNSNSIHKEPIILLFMLAGMRMFYEYCMPSYLLYDKKEMNRRALNIAR